MEHERLNSPDTSAILLEVLGHQLHFSQDPNSKHLGTTVWDASMVLVKFLEKNSRKGRFSASKLKGKRVIELGAGCGVAGFGMAMLGCDVVSTDQAEVLPLLMRNAERNSSRVTQVNPDNFGSIEVAELDWGNMDHVRAVCPPFDFVIGTDVVYSENLLEPLLHTILSLSGPKTTILLGYEIRSTNVHEQMLELWKRNFEVKIVPRSKMDSKYQHPSIQLFAMSLKPSETGKTDSQNNGAGTDQIISREVEDCNSDDTGVDELKDFDVAEEVDNENTGVDELKDFDVAEEVDNENVPIPSNLNDIEKLTEWETRRYGAMAARLLRDVKIT
ncbi:protein N-lysine methyltransferase METTL21D isoform X2 [Impatiens glandulifera]|uniref:protein N-lysine methyltransferase METTL21D isoform X2 n=1 Tax=Impatiens glandulifera TaxID=253017 RepID=UPI001FB12E41|nr:protein N-lysine methyltransferase METTL21D isoform X2 [Impatiens glandulifera]